MKRKWFVNDDFFEKIDSEEKAYLLGFFLADGSISLQSKCVDSWRLCVKNSTDDEEVIKLFQKYIIPDKPIFYKEGGYRNGSMHKPSCHVVWTSTKMKKDLEILYNITPRKTFDDKFVMNFNSFDLKYIKDFVRGVFDGDGCVSISHTNNRQSLNIQFYSTSELFLNQIANYLENLFPYIHRKITGRNRKNVTLYCLMFSTENQKTKFIQDLYTLFYKNATCYLTRKKNKFIQFLRFKYRANLEDCERFLSSVERS